MKVLHINSYEFKGGAETVFRFTSSIPVEHNYIGYVEYNDEFSKPSVKFHNWENDSKLIGIFNYIFSIYNYKRLKDFLNNYTVDVIHIHGIFAALSPSVLLAIKKFKAKSKIKVVQTLHDFHLICPNASLYNNSKNELCEKCIGKKFKLYILKDNCDRRGQIYSIIKGIRSFISNNIINHKIIIDEFISPSEFLKSKLISEGIDDKKIKVVRNPIAGFPEVSALSKKNIVCYFGRFSAEKNLKFLIDAFSCWKEKTRNDFQLLLIGEGEEEQYLKNHALNSNFKNDISFSKYLPIEKLKEKIKEVKYLAMTSSCYENFPMNVIEGLVVDIIPIVPNIGGMRESVKYFLEIGQTYSPNDTASWIEAIEFLEKNYEDQLKKLQSKKENTLKELRLEKYYARITSLYNQIK